MLTTCLVLLPLFQHPSADPTPRPPLHIRSTWTFEQSGTRIGAHTYCYEGRDDWLGRTAHRFSGWVHIEAVPALPVEQRYHGELWLDEQGRPLHHVLHATVGEQYSRVETTFTDGRAAAILVQGGRPREHSVDVPRDVLVQANNFIGWFELMLAPRLPEPGESAELQLFSSNGLQVLPYRISRRRTSDDRSPDAVYDDSLGERLTFAPDGRLLEIAIPTQALVIRRSDERFEPFTLTPPATEHDERFDYEEVTIENGPATLAGAITRLRGAPERSPAIFFASGSGLQDRDGRSSGIDLGTHEILDRLTAEGFLVLRVDDRGAGASSGPLTGIGYDELVSDALACVDFLLARPDVDPGRVAVIGHSEGGVTAPLLALERPALAAIVLMASSGRPMIEVMLDQNRAVLEDSGLEGEALEAGLVQVRSLLERLAGDGDLSAEELPDDQHGLLANRAWFQDHGRIDPAANLARVACPVLIAHGAEDFQVSAERDARALSEALAAAGHPDHELRVFPGLDHLFKKVRGDESSLAEYFTKRPVDPAFLDALAGWLTEELSPPAR